MQYYHASIEQFEKMLKVESLARTPYLLITLEDSDTKKVLAMLDRMNASILNTTRYITRVAFINKSGTNFKSSDPSVCKILNMITESIKQKTNLQLQIEERVESNPVGPYSDFFRSKDNLHNQFGIQFPESEIQDLIPAPEATDEKSQHFEVDLETDTISPVKFC